MALWEDGLQYGTRAAQPAASTVGEAVVYVVTDEGVIEQNQAGSWEQIGVATTAGLDFGEVGDIAASDFGDSALAGSTGEVADAGHRHAREALPSLADLAGLLDNLTDVDADTPSDGQALVWDDYQSLWVPGTVATGDVALDDLTDVSAGAPTDGQVLAWDDYQSLWVPSDQTGGGGASDLGDLGDVTVSGSETDGQVLTSDGAGGFAFEDATGGSSVTVSPTRIVFTIDSPAANDEVFVEVPFDCDIVAARLYGDVSGSAVVDVWNSATYRPTDSDSITASAPMTLSSADESEDTTLTGWTTSLTGGTGLLFHVDSVSTVGVLTVVLEVEASGAVLGDTWSPDVPASSPDTLDDEFEGASIAGKWTKVNDPSGDDALSQSLFTGYLHVGLDELDVTDNFDNLVRLYQTAPSGAAAAEYVAKVSLAADQWGQEGAEWSEVALYLGNSTDDEFIGACLEFNADDISTDTFKARSSLQAIGIEDNGSGGVTPTSTTTPQRGYAPGEFVYVKLVKESSSGYTSSQTYKVYASSDGVVWHQVGESTKTFTTACDEIGLFFRRPKSQTGTPHVMAACDFFRRTDSNGLGGLPVTPAAGAIASIDAGALTLLGRDDESEAEDDSFDGGSVDAKWLAYTGYDATLSVAAGDGWAAASSEGAKLQAVPGGGWSSIEAEFIAPDYLAAGYGNVGLILTNGTTESSATDARWGIGGDNTLGTKRFVSEKFVNGAFSTTYSQTTGLRYMPQRYRLRIVKDGTDYHFDYAFGDGGTWTRYYTESTLGFTPSHFGLHMSDGSKVNYFKVTT